MKMDNEEVEKLINKIAEYEINRNFALWHEEDVKKANKYDRKIDKAFDKIREYGDSAREKMTRLFEHENDSVKILAAASLLRYDTERAMAVLKKIAAKDNFNGFVAAQAIKRWEEGDWHLDPEE